MLSTIPKHIPYIIAGDFNVTLSAEERRGGYKIRDPFGERLEDMISLWGLSYIKPKNGNFTWNNRRLGLGHIAAILDTVFVSIHLLKNLSIPESKLLCLVVSDHKPI